MKKSAFALAAVIGTHVPKYSNVFASGVGDEQIDQEVGQYLVRYKSKAGLHEAMLEAMHFDVSGNFDTSINEMNLMSIKISATDMMKFSDDPNIEIIEKDHEMKIDLLRGNDPKPEESKINGSRRLYESVPYGIIMVQSPLVPELPNNATVMKVCVVDTGYGLDHPDLPTLSHGVAGWNDLSETYGLWNVDGHSHGTHCAGTIGAIGNNDAGVRGVYDDPSKFKFFIGKGLSDQGTAPTSNILAAVNACANAGAKVISMSLDTSEFSNIAQDTYKSVYDRNILLVASAGNTYDDSAHYPASYPYVMSVAAVDSDEQRASFSTYNEQVEIAAPGVSIRSTVTYSGGSYFSYGYKDGTSMACPHVAGVAAMVWSHFPECTNNQIRNILLKTAIDRGTRWCDINYGYGIVQAKAAYDLLKEKGCDAGGPVTDPLSDGAVGGCSQVPCLTPADCDDGNLCTTDTCLSNGKCENKRNEYCNPCQANETHVGIDLITDKFAYQTLWQIMDRNTYEVLHSGSGYDNEVTYHIDHCLANTSCYNFTITDSWGNGICCDSYYGYGNYTLWYGGKGLKLAHGGDFGESETVSIPCSPKEITTFSLDLLTDDYPMETTWEISDAKGDTVFNTGGPYDKAVQSKHMMLETELLASGCYNFSMFDSYGDGICCGFDAGNYSIAVDGAVRHTSDGKYKTVESTIFGRCPCEAGESVLRVALETDGHGEETFWYVKDLTGATVLNAVMESAVYASVSENDVAFCLPSDGCYNFTIEDAGENGICCDYGDGKYSVEWKDSLVATGGEFGSSETHQFGKCEK